MNEVNRPPGGPEEQVTQELPAVDDEPAAPPAGVEPVTRVERIEVPPVDGIETAHIRQVYAPGDGTGARDPGSEPPADGRQRHPSPEPEQVAWSEPPADGRQRHPSPEPEHVAWSEPPAGEPEGLDLFWSSPSAPQAAGPGAGLPRTGPAGGGPPGPPGWRRGAVIAVGALVMVLAVAGVAGVLLMRGGGEDRLGSLTGAITGSRNPATTVAAPPAEIVVAPANGQKKVKPDSRIRVIVSGGHLTSVKVTARGGGTVQGKLAAGGTSWESSGRMIPDTRYTVTARAENTEGKASTTKTTFSTLTPSAKLGTSIMPLDGETVGVGMPIGIFFTAPVTDKAAVERQLQVSTSSNVEGAWRWFGDRQVRWRPREFWPAGEKVTLRVRLAGIDAGGGVWGMGDRTVSFSVGDSHVSTVNVTTHEMTVAVNGKVVRTLPVSTGRQKFPTTNGVHTVLEKNRHKTMDSGTIGIPRGSPDYYRTEVEYAVRITNTGEFVHAAPWSEGSQGNANVSHGCVNLNIENGRWFFGLSRRGDVVRVVGSPRQPGETEGLLEWNRSFESWKAGSAL